MGLVIIVVAQILLFAFKKYEFYFIKDYYVTLSLIGLVIMLAGIVAPAYRLRAKIEIQREQNEIVVDLLKSHMEWFFKLTETDEATHKDVADQLKKNIEWFSKFLTKTDKATQENEAANQG